MGVAVVPQPSVRDHQARREYLAFLEALPIFQSLPPEALQAIATRIHPRRAMRGQAIFLEGDPASSLCILARGRVKLVHETDSGREVIIRLIRPGDIFGGAGIWGETRYPASAFAQEDSIVLHVPVAEFTSLVGTYPDVAFAIMRILAARLRDAEARIRELQTEQVEQRIANVLLRLAGKTGVKTENGIRIGTPLTRQDLAELSGTTLSTASRTLSAWHQRGIIGAGREQVTILQPHALVDIANHLTPERSRSGEDDPDDES